MQEKFVDTHQSRCRALWPGRPQQPPACPVNYSALCEDMTQCRGPEDGSTHDVSVDTNQQDHDDSHQSINWIHTTSAQHHLTNSVLTRCARSCRCNNSRTSLTSESHQTNLVPGQLCIDVDVQARITLHVDVDQLMKPDNINTRHWGVLVWQSQQPVRGRDSENTRRTHFSVKTSKSPTRSPTRMPVLFAGTVAPFVFSQTL